MALEGGEGSESRPAAFYPQERHGIHCTGGWVGPRAGLDRCWKSRFHRDSIPGPSSPQPVALPTELHGPHKNQKTVPIIHTLSWNYPFLASLSTSWRPILILSSHLCLVLVNDVFFFQTLRPKLRMHLSFIRVTCPDHFYSFIWSPE